MRRAISLVLAMAILIAGLFLIYWEAFEVRTVRGLVVMAGLFLTCLGGAWLWEDFLAPSGQKAPTK